MSKPHAKLRGKLIELGIDGEYLARKLLRGRTYISQCMMGRKTWQLDECYKILDLIGEPYSKLHEYFPPRGISNEQLSQKIQINAEASADSWGRSRQVHGGNLYRLDGHSSAVAVHRIRRARP